MDIDGFWRLIERSAAEGGTKDEREEWLTATLRELGPSEIEDFTIRLQELRDRIDHAHMWTAADVIKDGCSTDGFWYFQCWLIGRGREAFETVAADPDALAGLPAVRRLAAKPRGRWNDEEWPEWECLAYVAGHAYTDDDGSALWEAVEARGVRLRSDPLKPDWSREYHVPRLRELFPGSR
ncbi:hypothetical protein Ait01nite_095490 [Actinoplanes italicus]|uniref:Uncharacterized protein DUF4240 n=1 Tax=Actinoplanes italicus TaxID=113567 RepID=A0A2T0JN96_9ACTN|nr:DUF4240 domain-containing protein [Actinoplanes italicus]PRX08877.1 uncharacterized protein DUF4240 [Actinoplanes italicus]GIE36504.1 hypothetical protein Ait01nite_095490 [Actinoplanes italicus]